MAKPHEMRRRTALTALAAAAAGPVLSTVGLNAQSRAAQEPGRRSALKALAFDAYGTLFDVHSVIALCNEIFPGGGEALSQLWRNRQLEYTWLLSLMGRYEDFWRVTERALAFACTSLGLSCDARTRNRLMEAYLHLAAFPDVVPGLRALSRLQLAILSNGSLRMLDAAVQSAGLQDRFREIISVDGLRVYKPDPRVYGLAPHRLGIDAAAIGFVSSNSFDVQGAKAFGLWTCWVNRNQAPAEELGLEPDIVVSSLGALAEALQA